MNQRQSREHMTIRTTRDFLRDRRLVTGAFGPVLAALDDVLRRVDALAGPVYLAPGYPKGSRALSNELRRLHMIPIARRGKIIFRGDVQIETVLRVPHARDQPAAVVAAARAMVKRLRPYRSLLVEAGFPRTVLTDMQSVATRLAKMIADESKRREVRPFAFAELQRQIARGRREVRAADALVVAWIASQPPGDQKGLATAWRSVSRIGAKLGRPRKRRHVQHSGAS